MSNTKSVFCIYHEKYMFSWYFTILARHFSLLAKLRWVGSGQVVHNGDYLHGYEAMRPNEYFSSLKLIKSWHILLDLKLVRYLVLTLFPLSLVLYRFPFSPKMTSARSAIRYLLASFSQVEIKMWPFRPRVSLLMSSDQVRQMFSDRLVTYLKLLSE